MSDYERNVLFRSPLTGEFFFAPRVRVLDKTVRLVVGRKYNVTEALQPYLLNKFKTQPRRNGRKQSEHGEAEKRVRPTD